MNLNNKKITAVLGPTNTGKTHLAIETMLSFESGIIGFPLRLLAREVYDKIIQRTDISKVALITGEEKIIPMNAKYYLCTVESMPLNKLVDFVAIDEIQMCADNERGHVFTDRLLNFRGEKLTMFLGSHTIKNIINSLEEKVEFIFKDRFSKLSYVGHKKISRLNPKSAIIAFSIEEVYAIAELVRRQKGGSAIVMGSLSPKTRNSQVKLYQSGDVDYLVATDAIGMGLNMDLDNVYFSSLKKFDGKKLRKLNLSEISQIAGRAGRYRNDGSFGITGDCKELSAEEIELIESHKLEPIQYIFWRNSNLNFKNFESLINSLDEKPTKKILRRIYDCEDEKLLKFFLKEHSKYNILNEKNSLEIIWECCQIPDFVKHTYGHHLEVVSKVFGFLTSGKKKVLNKYMKKQLNSLDKLEGNVDSISNRIANVRTWSYVSNKKGWVENQDYWIERTKILEDKLSDRLHEELTKSFIDKRASILARGLKQDIDLKTEITDQKNVLIDGQYIGELKGLKLNLDLKIDSLDTDIKSLKKASRQGVGPELVKRINQIINSNILKLKEDFKIYWGNDPIAYLTPGKNYLEPNLNLIADDILEFENRNRLQIHLEQWLKKFIREKLTDLVNLNNIEKNNNSIRALCYQLFENNGVLKRDLVSEFVKQLSLDNRKILRKNGIKIGRYHIYLHKIIKPEAVTIRLLLWKNYYRKNMNLKPPKFGLNFIIEENNINSNFMLICGFEKFKNFYVRIDILERLFIKIIENTKDKEVKLQSEMMNLLGCTKENFLKLLVLMGYKYKERNKEIFFQYKPFRKKVFEKLKKVNKDDNPFNILNNVNFN
jgi:ATP-dependent RNA helicase SUPV3L1/SUV3|tara:strand:+ start:1172 stop:3655 length:2484 start_codon:yes stop_codon:yes gene_type:complete